MPNSSEIRAAAWRRLGEGAWLQAVTGFALIFLLGMAFGTMLERVGLSQGWIVQRSLSDLLAPLAQPEVLASMGCDELKVNVPSGGCRLAMLALSTAFGGILSFGGAVLAVSVMRGGARASQALCGFSRPFRTVVLAWLVTVRVALWSLLFVVPGVVAWYSYRMALFLLADHPGWSPSRALEESKKMMYGHRKRLACLDASFVGWWLLVVATCGLARVFVDPYATTAYAAFYEDLLDRAEANADESRPADADLV